MKLSDSLKKIFADSDLLLWVFPILLLIPNIMLDITENYSTLSKVANILLPAGWYYFIISLWRRTGTMVLIMTVFSFFAAFQIVLLNLYGESIIAIDMFINVATTNMSEATELLGNLLFAIALICILYIPPIAAGIIQTIKKSESSQKNRKRARSLGAILILVATLIVSIASKKDSSYKVERELFPVNVISNMCSAVTRTIATQHYKETSEKFSFNATPSHRPDMKEIYVLVVGETSRAENWSILGYDRPTNPRLQRRSNITAFPKAMSESNTTHKSVPMILSPLDSRTFGDSIYTTRSIFEAFNSSGFATAFISNQRRNHSFIDFFGEQASSTDFIIDDFDSPQYDMELVNRMRCFIDSISSTKIMIVLHAYGSHFNYRERYPGNAAVFKPDQNSEATKFNRDQLLNAYDNSIIYTDSVLDSLISVLSSYNEPAALLYLSDHGEDIFDDERNRFLHASPVGTYHQLHVPMLLWLSDQYKLSFPEKSEAATLNRLKNISSSASAFHTMLDLAGIDSPYGDSSLSLTDTAYTEPRRLFLNDYLEGVELRKSGLKEFDFQQMDKKKISY